MTVFKFDKEKVDMCIKAYILMNRNTPSIYCSKYAYEKMPIIHNPFSNDDDYYRAENIFNNEMNAIKIYTYLDENIPDGEIEIR